ncbi:3-phosphoserine/phosphohydroxythreonine transaminase [soil metagenome]
MRVHNFGAGPCALPLGVLEEVRDELTEYGHSGMSVVEMSHRSADYEVIHQETVAAARRISGAPEDFAVLFLQGGATLQFAMVPLNLLAPGERAGHVLSGSWAKAAYADAAALGTGYVAWDGSAGGYTNMPASGEVSLEEATRYLHITSNETIDGIRMIELPDVDVPLVADMSSEYLARPVDWSRYDLVYGGVQKNLAPAGMALVFVRSAALAETSDLGTYLRYETHIKGNSLANTPAMFQAWVMGKVFAHLEARGGVAGLVYRAIDSSEGFYRSHVEPLVRSHTNVVWRLPSEDLEKSFVAAASEAGMVGLKGHRSVGGIRASLYAATDITSVEVLVEFMTDFAAANR